MALRLEDKPELGAYHVDFASMVRRMRAIEAICEKSDRILFLGDDDLASLAVHFLGYHNLTVLDLDQQLLAVVKKHSRGRIRTVPHDLRGVYRGRLPRLGVKFDLFVTDPPYGADGLRAFSGVGLANLALGGMGLVATPERKAPVTNVGDPETLTHSLQEFLIASGGLLLRADSAAIRSYHGTVATMLWLKKHTRRKPRFDLLEGPGAFY